jgi:stage V sporulation protein AD
LQTIFFENKPRILATGTIAGPKECAGVVGKYVDKALADDMFGESTYEKAECKMLSFAISQAIKNAKAEERDVDMLISGDLLNQIISASFAARDFEFPFLGVYGACSTLAEAYALAATLIDGGYYQKIVAATGSHFSSAERQYRYPLELGNTRPPQSQWTVTGAGGAFIADMGAANSDIAITCATFGRVVDFGITDVNNMGAAMAPAAADTIAAHFNDTGLSPQHYDLIVTGDLGKTGSEALKQMLLEKGIDISENHADCGCMIFDFKTQDVHSGGSGCCCGGATLCGKLLGQIKDGIYSKILFVATGALMNTSTCLQGESIPCIAHAVTISREK